jgi:hypothetical protein
VYLVPLEVEAKLETHSQQCNDWKVNMGKHDLDEVYMSM